MITVRSISLALLLSVVTAAALHGQGTADSVAIRAAALDYIEGWYAGDAERMERALHPELAKRIVLRAPDGRVGPLRNMTASQLIESTGRGGGSRTPAEQRRTDVRILDIYENAASARIDAGEWIDYLHLARADDGWKIVNVLWERRPRDPSASPRD